VPDSDLEQLRPASSSHAAGDVGGHQEPTEEDVDVAIEAEGDEGVFAVTRGVTDAGHMGRYVMLTPAEADQYKHLGRRRDRPDIIVSEGTAAPAWFTAGRLKRVKQQQ
jgi:hypothetical protein